ncbi:MAG TPA: M64 family metallopeptidase [Polyangiaceae bacterium]
MSARAIYFDLFHRGTQTSESYVVSGSGPASFADPCFPGRLDARGEYRWSVSDAAGCLVASRGYSSLFAEWQSTVTNETDVREAEFRESHTVPWVPGGLFRIERRNPGGTHTQVFEQQLPATLSERRDSGPRESGRQLTTLHGTGPVRVLLVSEGYAAEDGERFSGDAERARDVLLAASPFAEQAALLSIEALFVPSSSAGIPKQPGEGVAGTNFATSYGIFGMTRYLVAMDLHALRRATDGIPWTTLIVLANAADYGGSGVFHSNCCVAAGMAPEDLGYVLPHELGHSFAGLADEYFGKLITYSLEMGPGWTPWEPNVSALDATGRPTWSSRIEPGVPVPTPWNQAEYLRLTTHSTEGEQPSNGISPSERKAQLTSAFSREPYRHVVGAFEGARYQTHGLFRPELDCRMFSRAAARFCCVCNDTILEALRDAAAPSRAPAPE